jgi:hypothetical protein
VSAFEILVPFPGLLVAIKRAGMQSRVVSGKFGLAMEAVTSGVASLDEQYTFRTDNPEAARTLVAGRLAEALQAVSTAWPGEPARIVLKGSDGFVLLPLKRNLFEVPGIWKAIDYTRDVEPIVADLSALLETAAMVREAGAPDARATPQAMAQGAV